MCVRLKDGAPADEIEITLEMIEAGVDEMKGRYFELIDEPELYPQILRSVLVRMLGENRISFPL